ncbi:ORFX protein [Cacao swollen shoot Ghana J virus]|uniref:ORFX protein n=1 Tax=Cacao swollen shoot Ghana J virus TaxID=2056880 RepID=UPI000CA18B0F|nr:ORFX protein [Cacao swollen shoot Ghana J virus]ATZ69468.1 ORFX protein [Cacao swollen shoot Ghana J virus]
MSQEERKYGKNLAMAMVDSFDTILSLKATMIPLILSQLDGVMSRKKFLILHAMKIMMTVMIVMMMKTGIHHFLILINQMQKKKRSIPTNKIPTNRMMRRRKMKNMLC